MKKILLLTFGLLTAFTALCQCPEDFWKNAVLIGDEPLEVQMGKGQAIIPLLFERKDTTTVEIWVITKKGTKPPDPGTKPDAIMYIDNLPGPGAGPGVVYSPATNLGQNVFNPNGWYHFKSTISVTWPNPAHNQSFSVLNTTGYVEISWIGYKFEWLSEKRLNHGIAAVSVDGAAAVDVDLYNPTTGNNSQVVYTWTDPSGTNKAHKVRISFTGRSNPATKETNIIHDAIKVYSKQ